jgi:hypothetical protein
MAQGPSHLQSPALEVASVHALGMAMMARVRRGAGAVSAAASGGLAVKLMRSVSAQITSNINEIADRPLTGRWVNIVARRVDKQPLQRRNHRVSSRTAKTSRA